jgi:hypothetical protein
VIKQKRRNDKYFIIAAAINLDLYNSKIAGRLLMKSLTNENMDIVLLKINQLLYSQHKIDFVSDKKNHE